MEPGKLGHVYLILDDNFLCPRACIGQRFAKLELYMMIAKIVQRYRMEYSGEKVGTITEFISVPDKPIKIKFVERNC